MLGFFMLVGLLGCGGGGATSGNLSNQGAINANEYTLPTALPSVPDQAAR